MDHIFIYDKGVISVTGVVSLDSFEEKEVRIKLENNTLNIKGSDFVLLEMSQSGKKVSFSGKISSLDYGFKADKSSFLNKLFK